MRETSLNYTVYDFSVDHSTTEKEDILNIHEYLIKKKIYKITFRLIKQVLIALLNFTGSLATNCIALHDQPCISRPTLINLNLDEHNQGCVITHLWLI